MSKAVTKVALIGATGNLGPAILKALLDADFDVTILTRQGSTSTTSLPSHPKQSIKEVDFNSIDSLTAALSGIEGVVSNIASHALLTQKPLIDASIAAGVKRFLPSEFGSDLGVKGNREVPFNAPKYEVHAYLEEKAVANPTFSWTAVSNGPFLDWCLMVGLFGDLKTHTATLWDGGNTRISTTTLPSVGKTVVGVFNNLEATKNKTIRVADVTLTQKQLFDHVTSVDGKQWTLTDGSTEEAYKAGIEEMQKPNANMQLAIMNQLYRIIFSEAHEPDMSGMLDNEVVGLQEMSEEDVKGVIKAILRQGSQ